MAPARDDRPIFVRDVADPEVADAKRYGGKASGLCRMMAAGVPAPPAFVIGAEGFHTFPVEWRKSRRWDDEPRFATRIATAGGGDGRVLRRRRASAARLRALRRRGQHARHDGHHSQSRPDGAFGARARAGPGGPRFALDTWMRFWRMFIDTVLDLDPTELAEAARDPETRALASAYRKRRSTRSSRRSSSHVARAGRARPRRSDGAARTRDRGGVPILGQPARQGLSAASRHFRRPRDGRHDSGDGVRQRGREFGLRRRVYAQSERWNEGALRRISDRPARRGPRRGDT